MNKDELAKRLARESHRSLAEAADDVDTLVYRLLKDLKYLKRPPRVAAAPTFRADPRSKS